ncbi:MAG: DoxX family protein [Bacteroidia bacterium]|nr:DoxX family protein [Bacteroidia bacterium]MBT8269734.1 DoxX family protein [Bacteroidia bacterium]NNF81434.1 DoxX family protein [Flavobacteriaceae bacterium]NNK69106.1 DoxX family protein [Flavobacteriaceae bacterium]NNL79031.1 DoxX family protein [Flavobacteriaceae bacterium]
MIKSNNSSLALTVLRVGISALMLGHGIPKINRLFESPIEFADPIGLGPTVSLILTLIGEVVAPVLIIVGWKTRLAAIPAFITMVVAAFVVHGADPFRKKEMAIIYALVFLVIMIGGPGKFSIDKN